MVGDLFIRMAQEHTLNRAKACTVVLPTLLLNSAANHGNKF
jgi:hypothetical protein